MKKQTIVYHYAEKKLTLQKESNKEDVIMKYKNLFLFAFLFISLTSFAEDCDTFTSQTEEGIEMTFMILSEESHTCQVGSGTTEPAIPIESEGALTIPSEAEGYAVVSIANFAFLDCTGISELTFSNSITTFANYCFLGVGTEGSPCLLNVPENYDLGVDTSGNFFRWKGGIFHIHHDPYACLSEDGTTLTFLYDSKESTKEGTIFKLNEKDNLPEWYSSRSSVTQVIFDPSFSKACPSTTNCWFKDMDQLSSITDIQYLNTSQTTQMSNMFEGCISLNAIDLENFDTSAATQMNNMFLNCKGLSSLDLSYFDFGKVADMSQMLSGCESLEELKFGMETITDSLQNADRLFSNCKNLRALDLSELTISENMSTVEMLGGCNSLDTLYVNITMNNLSSDACTGIGTMEKSCLLNAPEGLDISYLDNENFLWKSGLFHYPRKKAYVAVAENILTFHYDNKYDNLRSDSSQVIYFISEEISERTWSFDNMSTDSTSTCRVVFTPSFAQFYPTTTASWFALDYDMGSNSSGLRLAFEGMENLNTKEVTDMSNMFYGCVGATGLDVKTFDTSKVKDMSLMFAYCTTLTQINLDYFDTSNVTNFSGMFRCCSSLQSLDLRKLDTSNVSDMSGMFYGCINLERVYLTGLNTSNVEDMSGLFSHCHSLQSLDINSFDTSKVTTMSNMFAYCKGLTYLDISRFDLQNVTNMEAMFLKCNNLAEINLGDLETFNVTNMSGMFANCSSLTSLSLSNLELSSVASYDSPIIIQIGNWEDTENDEFLGFLEGCTSLKSLEIPISLNGLTEQSCIGVGTEISPCMIFAPEEYDFGTDTSGETFYWNGGYFTLDHTPDPNTTSLSVETDLLMVGSKSKMNINLYNNDEVFNGFQFEIHLPEGISLAKKNDNFDYQLSDRFSDKNMNISIKDHGNGNYRIIGFSLSNVTILGRSGNIITLKLKANHELLSGEYSGSLSNIVFSHVDGYSVDIDNVDFLISVSSFPLGDVNHDYYINVTDIMIMVNRILGNSPLNYYEENADMNSDGQINILDLMDIVNIILKDDYSYPENPYDYQ